MLFILLFLYSCNFINVHSELTTFTLYQTDDICQHNWKGSVCLPALPLNKTNQPLSFALDIDGHNQCPTQILVYIRSRQCIYCSKNYNDIFCSHRRLRRTVTTKRELIHRKHKTIIGISFLSILIIGSLLTLIFIKRSPAHTNLLELVNHQGIPNSNIQSINHIKVAGNIKSSHLDQSQPNRSTDSKKVKTQK